MVPAQQYDSRDFNHLSRSLWTGKWLYQVTKSPCHPPEVSQTLSHIFAVAGIGWRALRTVEDWFDAREVCRLESPAFMRLDLGTFTREPWCEASILARRLWRLGAIQIRTVAHVEGILHPCSLVKCLIRMLPVIAKLSKYQDLVGKVENLSTHAARIFQ